MRNFKLNLVFIFLLATLSFISSCDKSEHRLERQSEILKEAKIDNLENPQSNLEWTLSIPYPTANSLQELFQKDRLLIRNIVNNNDEIQAESYVRNLADQIAGYYYYNKNIDLRQDFPNDPANVILFGLTCAAKELYEQSETFGIRAPLNKKKGVETYYVAEDAFACFRTAVEAFIGIAYARELWASITAGVSERTIIGMLKFMGKKVATAIGVAWLVYDVGSCLDWW